MMILSGLVSAFHHRQFETNDAVNKLDRVFAVLALFVTSVTVWELMGITHWFLALTFLFVGLYFKRLAKGVHHDYDGFHTCWHICVFAGQLVLASSCL